MASFRSSSVDWYSAAIISGVFTVVGLGIVAYTIGGVFEVTQDY